VASTCLFVSGACSLVYQTVWLRTFRLIFGGSTPSTAAVLAIFMGGLGLGGILLGRRVERSSRPLITYGHLELGIAASTALTPFLLDAARAIYVGVGGSEGLGFASTFVRLILSTLVLGVPVVLMGGTLPAAARAVTAEQDVGRKGLSVLYGLNTLGSVAGAFLSTFFLLEIYGAQKTLWIACSLNAIIGMFARMWGRRLDPVVAPAPAPRSSTSGLQSTSWVLAAAFITGFVFLIAELVWYRLATPLLGGSTYTFGLVLVCALLGIGLGGLLYAFMGPKEPTAASFAVTCALEGLVLLLPYAAGDEIAHFATAVAAWGKVSFPLLVVSWGVVAAVLVFPAAVVAGYQFPMLLSLKGKAAREVGKDSGEVYAANTLGSIAGSLSGGFALLPAMTALGLWRASAAVLVALAAVVALIGRRDRGRLAAVSVLAAASVACLLATGPTAVWRHSSHRELTTSTWNERRYVENETRRAVAAEFEGRESSVAVDTDDGVRPLVNGSADADSTLDAPTGVGSGLIPAALNASSSGAGPKSAFVIGLGTGQSAGWLGALPSIERVDVAELEPEMTRFAALCDATNQSMLKNPKVHVHIADGRELLAVTRQRYDVVLSQSSNPAQSGAASLYSRDFYEAVRDKLTDDGVFGQWVDVDGVEAEAVQLVVATMRSAFPHLSAWQLGPRDMLLVATKKPQTWDANRLRSLASTEPYHTAFQRLFGVTGAEGVLALHLASDAMLDKIAAGADDDVDTDDLPRLEYLFARSGNEHVGDDMRLDLFALARERKLDRPNVVGTVDWTKVDEQRARPMLWRNEMPRGPISIALPPPLRLWASGRSADATVAFDALRGQRALDPFETIVATAARADVAESDRTAFEALAADASADGYVADAAWLKVRAALTDHRARELPSLVAAAVKATEDDPWPTDRIVLPTLDELGDAPATGAEVDALNENLRAFNFRIARATTAFRLENQLAKNEPRAPQCVRTLAAFEPWPRWRADFLDLRRRCYERARPDLAAVAAAELDTYLAHAGGPFVVADGS
jgi:predicted membrane-bound spermidine synthase